MTQSDPARLDRLSAELAMYAGRLARAVTRVADHDVPRASLRLMAQLDELGPSTVGRLAEADRCSQPTMSAAVSALTERGWASKTPHPGDARSCLVQLTSTGLEVLADARARNAATIRARFAGDPDHDITDLATTVAVLKNLLAQADPQGPDTAAPPTRPIRGAR